MHNVTFRNLYLCLEKLLDQGKHILGQLGVKLLVLGLLQVEPLEQQLEVGPLEVQPLVEPLEVDPLEELALEVDLNMDLEQREGIEMGDRMGVRHMVVVGYMLVVDYMVEDYYMMEDIAVDYMEEIGINNLIKNMEEEY